MDFDTNSESREEINGMTPFVDTFWLDPTGRGILDGMSFAVKDLIDVAGKISGCGNPTWRDTHPPATAHAVCVEQLLAAGAHCIGKTITDELALSILGENYFYGTPLNPKAPDRVPGGSSSGSASAVASGQVDLALGTDTGGSVRIPATNCGIYGFRPTHGVVSVAGINPLSPTFDTVGIFAASPELLVRGMSVLLAAQVPAFAPPSAIHLIREAFALCDAEVAAALQPAIRRLRDLFGSAVRETSIREIDQEEGAEDLQNWHEIYRTLLRAEVESCLGGWIAHAKPVFGSMVSDNFELVHSLDRGLIPGMVARREIYFHKMKRFLGSHDLLCIPTTPSPAPLKGSIVKREASGPGYYPRALSLTAIAGTARLPQVAFPAGDVDGAPVGLSLLAANHEDAFLLSVVRGLAEKL